MRAFLALLALLLVATLAFAGWLAWAVMTPVAPPAQRFVMLRPGYSTRRIADELKLAGVIRSKLAFVLWHRYHRRQSLKAGEYLFEAPAAARDVHERLVRGDVYVHTVVIPEGFTMFDIARAIQDSGLGSEQRFLELARSETGLISDLDPDAKSLEGYLFPNTYGFTRTQGMKDIVSTMVRQFRQVAQQIGLTADVRRMVTMASIVEKETAVPGERALVAGVYQNRLSQKMALQADPSVIYAELLAGTYGGALHHADMQFHSAYNTYLHAGLPPGPIANPGRTSLEAALHPAETRFLYFVSDGNGRHRFSRSLEEHNQNVAKLRHAVRAR